MSQGAVSHVSHKSIHTATSVVASKKSLRNVRKSSSCGYSMYLCKDTARCKLIIKPFIYIYVLCASSIAIEAV